MSDPINPVLYAALQRYFGEVRVSNPGLAASGNYVRLPGMKQARFQFSSAGEYYRVNCPFCKDRGFRLWIHHLWGRADEQGNCRWWSAICYNENCLENPSNLQDLRVRVYGQTGRAPARMPLRPGTTMHGPLSAVTWPGKCVSLSELSPGHAARTYLVSRGFDPLQLTRAYNVRYCMDPQDAPSIVGGRLVIPVYYRGKMVGWQARLPADLDWKLLRVPKYYNLPGMPKSRLLYGLDSAKELPVVVLVEGITDVWRLGPGAVAAFGDTLSYHQAQLLLRGGWKALVTMLDSDDSHAKIAGRIAELRHAGLPVCRAEIPPNKDPAELSTDEAWDHIAQALSSAGLSVAITATSRRDGHDNS